MWHAAGARIKMDPTLVVQTPGTRQHLQALSVSRARPRYLNDKISIEFHLHAMGENYVYSPPLSRAPMFAMLRKVTNHNRRSAHAERLCQHWHWRNHDAFIFRIRLDFKRPER